MERWRYILICACTTFAFVHSTPDSTPSVDDVNYLNVFRENHDLVPKLKSLNFCYDAHFRLQLMYETEIKIVEEVLQILNKTTDKTDLNDKIKQVFNLLKDKHISEMKHAKFLHHPLNVLKFFRRIWDNFNPILKKISIIKDESPRYANIYKIIMKHLKKPDLQCWLRNKQDISRSIHSLVQLIWAYKIPVDQFAQGNIFGHQSVEPLPLRDLIQIMDHAFRSKLYQISKDMGLFLIKERLEMMKDIPNLQQKVYRLTAHSYHRTGDTKNAIKLCEKYLKKHRDDSHLLEDVSLFKKNKKYRSENLSNEKKLVNLYYNVCRTGTFQPKGFCIYHRPLNGWYRVKEEIMNLNPYVSQFYDVIHDVEIDILIKLAKENMHKSSIYADPNNAQADHEARLSQTSWVNDARHPIVHQLGLRIGFITHLHVAQPHPFNSEDFQVVNYGFGGMFQPHTDYLIEGRFDGKAVVYAKNLVHGRGDRLATWMFYLSDVAVGGGTAFVFANVTVPAVKGSAAFWYNIREDGQRDVYTYHGGCPVLIGEKWISNKWINEDNQFLMRPCLLQRNEKILMPNLQEILK